MESKYSPSLFLTKRSKKSVAHIQESVVHNELSGWCVVCCALYSFIYLGNLCAILRVESCLVVLILLLVVVSIYIYILKYTI